MQFLVFHLSRSKWYCLCLNKISCSGKWWQILCSLIFAPVQTHSTPVQLPSPSLVSPSPPPSPSPTSTSTSTLYIKKQMLFTKRFTMKIHKIHKKGLCSICNKDLQFTMKILRPNCCRIWSSICSTLNWGRYIPLLMYVHIIIIIAIIYLSSLSSSQAFGFVSGCHYPNCTRIPILPLPCTTTPQLSSPTLWEGEKIN